jgi:hemerythrin-like domain-containing protein
MTSTATGSVLASSPAPDAFSEPLDALLAEHFRQRAMCDLLEDVAREPSALRAGETARLILSYLRDQLPLHIADEERDLFQLLKDRTLAVEAIEGAFAQLHKEHCEDEQVASLVTAGLEQIAGGRVPDDCEEFSGAVRAFAEAQRRHVAYENSAILPLARNRLTRKDLRRLARRMAARRGMKPSAEAIAPG